MKDTTDKETAAQKNDLRDAWRFAGCEIMDDKPYVSVSAWKDYLRSKNPDLNENVLKKKFKPKSTTSMVTPLVEKEIILKHEKLPGYYVIDDTLASSMVISAEAAEIFDDVSGINKTGPAQAKVDKRITAPINDLKDAWHYGGCRVLDDKPYITVSAWKEYLRSQNPYGSKETLEQKNNPIFENSFIKSLVEKGIVELCKNPFSSYALKKDRISSISVNDPVQDKHRTIEMFKSPLINNGCKILNEAGSAFQCENGFIIVDEGIAKEMKVATDQNENTELAYESKEDY